MMLALSLAIDASGADLMSFADAKMKQLDNGLVVLVEENHRTDTVALHMAYGVGSRDELPGEYGCAHLFEHLMFEGSAHVPGDAFDRWLTRAGGSNNAFTSEDVTAYHMTFPSSAIDLALFLESDRLGFLDAGIDATNVANQQDVVLQERAQGYAQPNGRDWDALSRVIWPPTHPYHRPVIGTVADIRGFGPDGVLSFWKRHYRAHNAVLALVGNFDADQTLTRVEHWFSDIEDPGPPPARSVETPPFDALPGLAGESALADASSLAARAGVIEDDVEHRTLWLAWHTVGEKHPDAPALDLLAEALAGGRGTRLEDRLRYDRPLAHEADLMSVAMGIDGQMVAYAASERTSLSRLRDEILGVVADLDRHPITAAELERARNSAKAAWLDSLESVENRAEQLATCYLDWGRMDCVVADWARYQAVRPEDLNRVAATWLRPERAVTLSVVPRGDPGKLEGAVPVELP